jgi:hypothetical protein
MARRTEREIDEIHAAMYQRASAESYANARDRRDNNHGWGFPYWADLAAQQSTYARKVMGFEE